MKKSAALLAAALAALALAACGGSDENTTSETGGETTSGTAAGGGGATLAFEADPDGGLAYTSDEVTTEGGEITIDFNNPQSLPHDVAIEDSSGETVAKTDVISDSSTSTTADLEPGKYTFYCTVPGHREGGMEGTLIVE